MKFSLTPGRWIDRLKMLYYLPFSDRSLRYFPPEFTFRDPIVSLAKKYRQQGHACGLILLYLEDFHHIFATYPYSVTAKLQQNIRETLLRLLPSFFDNKDIIGVRQYRGEDFCVFVKEYSGLQYDELQRKGMLLRKELEKELRRSADLHMNGSISFQAGCYIMDKDLENTEAAIQSAYHYAHSIATKKLPPHFTQSRQQLLDILQNEDISVLAQPIMNLHTGEIYGYEILTRGPLNSPFHTPYELFEFAYQADLLSRMELLVLKKAFYEIAKRNIKEQVFINLTPVSLCHPLFQHELLQIMKDYPEITPSQIVLEITERHAIRDFEYMGSLMAAYRALGFRFAVDDAGAGYSSLQSISELIPDMIKIDRSVISHIDQALVKQSLLKALLDFAENINCQVIAEGIERPEEANMLFDMQVKMGQGFYFARPEPLVTDLERGVKMQLVKEKIQQHRQVATPA
jgi:EAL domain-containing protein (putative c-di-GMP-specific phosphodiesterase class I)/GGDEF domain-containing protein